jgi:hypothetical protein
VIKFKQKNHEQFKSSSVNNGHRFCGTTNTSPINDFNPYTLRISDFRRSDHCNHIWHPSSTLKFDIFDVIPKENNCALKCGDLAGPMADLHLPSVLESRRTSHFRTQQKPELQSFSAFAGQQHGFSYQGSGAMDGKLRPDTLASVTTRFNAPRFSFVWLTPKCGVRVYWTGDHFSWLSHRRTRAAFVAAEFRDAQVRMGWSYQPNVYSAIWKQKTTK